VAYGTYVRNRYDLQGHGEGLSGPSTTARYMPPGAAGPGLLAAAPPHPDCGRQRASPIGYVTNGFGLLYTIQALLVFHKLNSAIERGTKPDAVGWKSCHCISMLKAAMVNASRAWKDTHTQCITFVK
jgi:hypothetical protein